MKNIETILKEAGVELTEEQKTSINKAVSENYKTVAEFEKQTRKLETAQEAQRTAEENLEKANETIKGFDGSMSADDVKKLKDDYEAKINEAKQESERNLTQRDQKDFLNAEFDKLGITSERTRKSLAADIMGEDGLKWKDGKFMGLADYLSTENEKDHFYKTEEEKKLEGQQQNAAGKVPKITEPSFGQKEPPKGNKVVPVIW